MKNMKKLLCLLVCFCLFFSLSSPAFSATGDIDEEFCMPSGDLNNDGKFSTEDVIISLKIADKQASATPEQIENGDIDRDGYVTTSDALMLLQYIAGQDSLPEHIYTPWEAVTEPTCTVNGIEKCQCTICYSTFKKFTAPLGHNYEDDICTRCGSTIGIKSVLYNNKEIPFEKSTAAVKSLLGNPTEALSDGNATIYIYCKDYTNLGIFTFIDDSLSQFYANSLDAGLRYADKTFHLSDVYDYSQSTVYEVLETIDITAYVDLTDVYAYAFLATSGEKYTFKSSTSYRVHEKINFHLLNGCRAINGIAPLTYCKNAASVAFNHSADMANNGFFAHENLQGLSSGDRLSSAGINWQVCGENIAASVFNAYDANNGWYNSAGHRSNMLYSTFEKVGVGISYNSTSPYRYYATQNFYTD